MNKDLLELLNKHYQAQKKLSAAKESEVSLRNQVATCGLFNVGENDIAKGVKTRAIDNTWKVKATFDFNPILSQEEAEEAYNSAVTVSDVEALKLFKIKREFCNELFNSLSVDEQSEIVAKCFKSVASIDKTAYLASSNEMKNALAPYLCAKPKMPVIKYEKSSEN